MQLPVSASTVDFFYLTFDKRATQQQWVEYAAVMERVIGLVAVIGLTVTAVMGCASSGESEPTSLHLDCGNAGEILRLKGDVRAQAARIWPQMNDPDLKFIFRALAEPQVDYKDLLNPDPDYYLQDPNWIAFNSICPAGSDSCTESEWLDIPSVCRFIG